MNLAHWNIEGNIYKHETEIEKLLVEENIDIMFLSETDNRYIDTEFKMLNYKAFIHHKQNENDKTRLLALVKSDIENSVTQRNNLEIENYPIIYLEVTLQNGKKLIVGAVYRQWGKNQQEEMNELTKSIDNAGDENKEMVILSDMNLCKAKFNEKNYPYKILRDKLLNCIARNDLKMADLPPTFQSKSNGATSEIDHIYFSSSLEKKTKYRLGDSSASDHMQVLVEINVNKNDIGKKAHQFKHVRSYKNFNQNQFNNDLAQQEWERIGETEDVNEMVKIFNELVENAFNKNVPLIKVKIHNHHILGITDETKEMLRARNKARRDKSDEYKKLRNVCNRLIRRDKKNVASKAVEKNPHNIWKIYNETVNGKQDRNIILKEGNNIIEDDFEIAEIFNKFFKEKIAKLKSSLPEIDGKDPLEKMKMHVGNKDCKFAIRTISISEAKLALRKLKPKMSSGPTQIPKKLIKNANEVLCVPFQRIFNTSVRLAKFPDEYRNLIAVPVHKRNSKQEKSNFRQIVSIDPVCAS